MRFPLIPVIVLLLVNCCIDFYIWRVLRSRLKSRVWSMVQFATSAVLFVAMVVLICLPKRHGDDGGFVYLMWGLYAYVSIYASKLIFVLFDLLARIPELFRHKRWRGLSVCGAVLALLAFGLMWWGALINRYRLDVQEVEFASPQVPEVFDGFRIVQISDLHTGSYGENPDFLRKMVAEIDSLHPDMVVFTGDIVNRHSAELEPFVSTLARLEAPCGVYSILGNHDYGDYYDWSSDGAKRENMELLYDQHERMGWELLRNRTVPIVAGADTLMLIGVENVGDPPFKSYGDLRKAYPDPSDSHFKILLSHNPAHWTAQIKGQPDVNIPLTLSGHTHAMQMSIGRSISPAVLRYDTWGGMYADSIGHSLYVNTGMGEVGFPARIGATPEITVITLRHSK